MAQPTAYVITTDFSNEEASGVAGRSTVRTSAVDVEFVNIATTVGQILANMAALQRDDLKLIDLSVQLHTLSTEVLALLGSAGFTIHSPIGWLTATNYPARDMVKQGTGTYVSVVAHTSGVFATDLAAGKWVLIFDTSAYLASGVAFSPTGTIAATNVQAAIAEVAIESLQVSAVSAFVQTLLNDADSNAFLTTLTATRAEAGAVAVTLLEKERQIVSVKDFGALGDWNGASGTNNQSAIQAALNTGKSILVPSGRYYLGQDNSGNFLTFTASGQCVYFADGASFVALGNNNVTNTASFITTDSKDGNYLYNPVFESNGTVLTTLTRDSPYSFTALCTTAHVNGCGIINGKATLCQSPFLASKTSFANAFEVNNVYLDVFADRSYYGAVFSNTGNNVRGQIHALDVHRAIIAYGCSNHDLLIYDRHVSNLTALSQVLLGVGVDNQATTNKNTTGLRWKYKTIGSTYSGLPFVFSAQMATGNTGLKIRDCEIDYDDTGNPGAVGISFQYTLDSVLQTSFTGTIFDGITLKGRSVNVIDLTAQGSIGSPLTQTVKGYADFQNLSIPALTGINDPMNGYLFTGPRARSTTEKIGFTPTIVGLTVAGAGTYSTQYGRARKVGTTVYFDVNLTWSAHTGTGNMAVGLAALTTTYPVVNQTGYAAVCPVAASNITFPAQLSALMQTGIADAYLYTFATGAALTGLAIDTAGSIYISGSYETNN